jgi:hypothetical protein
MATTTTNTVKSLNPILKWLLGLFISTFENITNVEAAINWIITNYLPSKDDATVLHILEFLQSGLTTALSSGVITDPAEVNDVNIALQLINVAISDIPNVPATSTPAKSVTVSGLKAVTSVAK